MEPAPPLSESERARGRQLAIGGNAVGVPFSVAFTEQLPTLALVALGASETLIGLLKRLHENLPQVEVATERYLAERFPRAVRRPSL